MRRVAAAALLLAAASCAHTGAAGAPPDMVRVAAGWFTMGDDDGPLNERPEHRVVLDRYFVDRAEVTAADFARFLNAEGNPAERHFTPDERSTVVLVAGEDPGRAFAPRPGYERHPANNVSWFGADAYCRWRGRRLPTEAEWEKAARGADARRFPWGGAPPAPERARFAQSWDASGIDVLAPVGTRPEGMSAHGLHDMAGNVLEWVSDWYRQNLCDFCNPDEEAGLPLARFLAGGGAPGPGGTRAVRQVPPRENPAGPGAGAFRVLRGGSWKDHGAAELSTTRRFWLAPAQRFPDTGFRCAL